MSISERLYWYRFTVKGNGVFPFDMLRRDRCFPYATEDATRMGDLTMINNGYPVREVELASWQNRATWMPNFERWKSFNWQVTQVVQE